MATSLCEACHGKGLITPGNPCTICNGRGTRPRLEVRLRVLEAADVEPSAGSPQRRMIILSSAEIGGMVVARVVTEHGMETLVRVRPDRFASAVAKVFEETDRR